MHSPGAMFVQLSEDIALSSYPPIVVTSHTWLAIEDMQCG